eukprot:CAMPEP_0197521914 /NCGR_PEP_ID=MMETSP1318-20131121/7126_1 /TAXON_ID=552666 /ORGANISM="Partenskyella glossopodia, Strain RCC365" /LENGTH=117 /DNA_ID=CAMNT_0043074077 /DNA_START=426 /DNA_END=779 /DNA_ORIENTATION=-
MSSSSLLASSSLRHPADGDDSFLVSPREELVVGSPPPEFNSTEILFQLASRESHSRAEEEKDPHYKRVKMRYFLSLKKKGLAIDPMDNLGSSLGKRETPHSKPIPIQRKQTLWNIDM